MKITLTKDEVSLNGTPNELALVLGYESIKELQKDYPESMPGDSIAALIKDEQRDNSGLDIIVEKL